LAEIVNHPKKYHIKLDPIPVKPYFTAVDIGFQINLAQAAEMANISLTELYLLNPGYNRWSTDPDGPHQLLLPIEVLSIFENNLIKQTGKHSKVARHTVKSNETLEQISKKYHTTKTSILAANHISYTQVQPSQVLLIPKNTHIIPLQEHNENIKKRSLKSRFNGQLYIVKAGDSLWKIAKNYELSVNQLILANKDLNNSLRPGQKLNIPNPRATATG